MTTTYDVEYELFHTAIHEAGHILYILRLENMQLGLFDSAAIAEEGEGITEWYATEEDHPEYHKSRLAGMVGAKVFGGRFDWTDGSDYDLDNAREDFANEMDILKARHNLARSFGRRENKAKLLAIALLLLKHGEVDRDQVLKTLGQNL